MPPWAIIFYDAYKYILQFSWPIMDPQHGQLLC